MKRIKTVRALCESAILLALAVVLSYVKFFQLPFDGAITLASMLPICLISLIFAVSIAPVDWHLAFPYLLGSALGGFGAGICGGKIPVKWLHRGLGILILAGGIRCLC